MKKPHAARVDRDPPSLDTVRNHLPHEESASARLDDDEAAHMKVVHEGSCMKVVHEGSCVEE